MNKPKFNPSEAAAKMFISTQQTQDAHEVHDTHSTQGTQRKQRFPRINMAFYGDNLEYLREAAWLAKKTITQYVNDLIEEDRKKPRS